MQKLRMRAGGMLAMHASVSSDGATGSYDHSRVPGGLEQNERGSTQKGPAAAAGDQDGGAGTRRLLQLAPTKRPVMTTARCCPIIIRVTITGPTDLELNGGAHSSSGPE